MIRIYMIRIYMIFKVRDRSHLLRLTGEKHEQNFSKYFQKQIKKLYKFSELFNLAFNSFAF